MNASQFMDKQIMEFSGLQQQQQQPRPQITEDKDDHNNYSRTAAAATSDGDDDGGGGCRMGLEEDIVPSYDFHQIRTPVVDPYPPPPPPLPPPPPPPITTHAASADSSSRNFGLPESHESSEFIREKEKDMCDIAMLVEIDRAVKKHADNLLYSLEGISSRLSQLETRSRQLENSVDELKLTFGDNVGSTGGKLRQLEIILREVQTGMQALHDNRESLEAQQPPKTQSMSDHEYLHAAPPHSMQQPAAAPQQPLQQPPQPSVPSQRHPTLPAPPAPPATNAPPIPQQTIPPVQFPPALPQTQIPSVPSLPGQQSFPQPSQPEEPTNKRYLAPVQQSPPPLAQQHYQQPPLQQHCQVPPLLPPYSQPLPAQVQSPLPHNPEETLPYMAPPQQTYPPTSRPPSASLPSQPPSVPHQQQFYRPSSRMYEMPVSRPGIGLAPYSTGYGTSLGPGFMESYNYSGSPSHYSSSSMNPPPFSSSVLPGGESNFPWLPTAKLLPQATPVGSGSGGSGGNRVPIDDVVDKVATMGFSREQVRATVRKLTENGQSVDLNVVLDKLMNDGGNGPPRRDW